MSVLEANLAKAEQYLARFRKQGVQNQIGGAAVPASDGTTFETISPVDLKPLAKVAHGKAPDIDRAAKAAKRAFPAWAALAGEKRKELLHKIADAIVARAEEIAFVECMDTGQALKFMAKAALRGAENFRFFADRAPEARMASRSRAEDHLNYHLAPADRPRRHHHAVEHAVHALDLEDRAGAGGGLHGRPQAGGMVAADRELLAEIAEEAGLPPGVLEHRQRLG